MLKHLQTSVEEEEVVWKSKMADSEEQLRVVRHLLFFVGFFFGFFSLFPPSPN